MRRTSDSAVLPGLPAPSRSPWQLLYAAAHRVRRRRGTATAARLPRPVLSVGNLHWGGTGKTPIVAAVTRHLLERGLRPAILSRGYGREGSQVRIVSTGEGPLLGPSLAGDEPVALAAELPGAAVVVAAERYLAGLHALERLSPDPDCFVLDDGFSHLALARDLDLVVVPSADPWGGGRLAPSGRLREPLAAIRHASAVLVSNAEPPAGREAAERLRELGFDGPGFSCPIEILPPRTEREEALMDGEPVFLVSGIARASRFRETCAKLPLAVQGFLEFRDHHRYGRGDLERIDRAAAESGARFVLTTTKDFVKLLGRLETPLAQLPVRAIPEDGLWSWLDAELDDCIERLSGTGSE